MGKRSGYRMVDEHDPHWMRFWDAYPSRVSKKEARKAWAKLNPSPGLVDRMLVTLEWQVTLWTRQGYGTPYPASWLNAERWTDEQPGGPRMAVVESTARCYYGHTPPCITSSECRERFFREARDARKAEAS